MALDAAATGTLGNAAGTGARALFVWHSEWHVRTRCNSGRGMLGELARGGNADAAEEQMQVEDSLSPRSGVWAAGCCAQTGNAWSRGLCFELPLPSMRDQP